VTLPPAPSRAFASDNAAGAHPAVLHAISAANEGHALAYGDDDHTRECSARFRELFGADVTTRLVFNGTGANVLALGTLLGSLPGPHHGVVCTDWAHIAVDETGAPERALATKLIMEDATEEERVQKIIEAGVDQFGGESCSETIVKLVNDGKITEERIDASVRRILKLKFEMGLFDDPYVDKDKAISIVGNDRFGAAADKMHRKSFVLLKNDTVNGSPVLPLSKGLKIYVRNMDEEKVATYGTVVKKPEDADVALIRLQCPAYKLPGTGLLGALIKGGDLDFKGKEKEEILSLLSSVPTVVDITMDRPAVIPGIAMVSKGLFASFGSPDEAFLDLVFGNFNPQGRLPFEMPSSMEAVKNQLEDLPYDSKDPLFPFGFGLSY